MNDFYKGKNVLVTGNTGFKGSWMTHMLVALGANVTGVALSPNTDPNIYDILDEKKIISENILDIRDYDGLEKIFDETKPEIVFHLAAQP
nr:GDP-mannose 4,6-dehydratase [Lachnospiraceae bacterium]